MITDPLFYVVAVIAVLLVGISKGGFGGTLGLLAVPLMSLAVSPVAAAAVMLPILCVMDLLLLRSFKKKWSRDNLIVLLPGALIGIFIGWLFFKILRPSDIKLAIGILALLFVAGWYSGFFGTKQARVASPPRRADGPMGVFWGSLSGFSSFIAHAGGPPVSIHLLPQRLDKAIFQGTTVIYFTTVNYVKLVPYTALGLFDTSLLTTSLVLLPLAPLGIWLGAYLHDRVDELLFYRICTVLLGLVGLKLTWDGLMPLL